MRQLPKIGRILLASLASSTLFLFYFVERVEAHCPLCTTGAAIVAGTAAMLGINQMSIGVFVGAFALSTGSWFSNMLKEYIPYQKVIVILSSFLLTVFPLTSIMSDFYPVYIHIVGDYGSFLNRTYLINLFFVGSIIGAIVAFIAPGISWRIALKRRKAIRYQGVIITLALITLVSVFIHFLISNLLTNQL
jgi:hypothetical protein